MVFLLCLVTLWVLPLPTHAASMGLAWDYPQTPAGFFIRRCTVPASSNVCTPTTDLTPARIAGTLRTYTDTTAADGMAYCWTVQAVDTAGMRSPPAMADNTTIPYVCKQVGGTLPAPGALIVKKGAAGMDLTWSAATFDTTTVPSTALVGYQVWVRGDPSPPGAEWVLLLTTPKTVTTYTHPTPYVGGSCYQLSADYGPGRAKDGNLVCLTLTPDPLPAPTNLREVP